MNEHWANSFADSLAATIAEIRPTLGNAPVSILALDCHPWNGDIFLAILTLAEIQDDPEIAQTAEMAAWKNYDCGAGSAVWQQTRQLGLELKSIYERVDDKAVATDECFGLCVASLKSDQVQAEIDNLVVADDFRISCAHPDTELEYYG